MMPTYSIKMKHALIIHRFILWIRSLLLRPEQDLLKLLVKSRMSRLETWSLCQLAQNTSS